MNICKKGMAVLLVLLLVFLAAGCGTVEASVETRKVVFPERFMNVVEMPAEDWLEELETIGQGQYEDLYLNEDGVSITLEITQEQLDFWVAYGEKGFAQLRQAFSRLDPAYQIVCSEDYVHLDFYYNLELSAVDAVYYVMKAQYYCIYQQLFSPEADGTWYVSANIYNSDTGNLVTSGDSDTGLSYETSDWEASK